MTRSDAGRLVAQMAYRAFRRCSFRCEALEARRLLSAGDLDPSFGGDGDTDLGSSPFQGSDVAVQADGKTVVAGTIEPHDGFAVTRYNLNGTPDTTFGPDHNGTVLRRFGDGVGHGVAIQPDGKIVVVGEAGDETRVVRYNPDGALDRSFDGDGIVGFDPGGILDFIDFYQVIIQPDNKILLGGSGVTGIFDSNSDLAFSRLNPDGSFDSDFGDDGIRVIGFGDNENFGGMALDFSGTPATNPDYGKIVAASSRYNDVRDHSAILVTRLTTGGDLDRGFDGDGSALVSYPFTQLTEACAVVVEDSGRIVVGGTVGRHDFLMAGFERGGPLDTTFGPEHTGFVTTDLGYTEQATDLMIAPSGALILAGRSTAGSGSSITLRDGIAAYTPDGALDTRFGGDGKMLFSFNRDYSLAAGPGRRFVFAGGFDMHAARFFDVGANLVYAATLNSVASETGPTARGFFVYRLERLPVATRVYFDVGGTAVAPGIINFRFRDYTADGMAFPDPIFGEGGPPYVDIPANQTFTVVTITPVDDTRVEGNETAVFTVRADGGYEVGDPKTVTLVITDNDAPPPTVAEVYVRGSAWKGTDGDDLNVTFKEYLAASAQGDAELGYRVDNLAAAATLPWTNVDQVVLRYTAPPTGSARPAPGAVTLDGIRSDYSVIAVDAIDPSTFLLTLDRSLGNEPAPSTGNNGDRVTLSVPGGGPNGSAYAMVLSTLQGDADRAGGRVTALDVAFIKARINRTATSGGTYTPLADINADGRINALDVAAAKGRLGDTLPIVIVSVAFPPVAPLFGDRLLLSAASERESILA